MRRAGGGRKPWYAAGLRFSCTRCHRCCTATDGYDYVHLDDRELRAMARLKGLPPADFERRFCAFTAGLRHLRFTTDLCPMHDGEGCTVYEARPAQCRTWPFWPETVRRRAWHREVLPRCPGAGTGRLHSAARIQRSCREADRSLSGPMTPFSV